MKVGSIVFGPAPSKPGLEGSLKAYQGVTGSKALAGHACNCIGPQPGQTKCPCALRGESEMGRKMVEEGVTVNGKRYRLVPEE
jgi:hypothetical protein